MRDNDCDNDVNLCVCEFRCILVQTRGVAFPLILCPGVLFFFTPGAWEPRTGRNRLLLSYAVLRALVRPWSWTRLRTRANSCSVSDRFAGTLKSGVSLWSWAQGFLVSHYVSHYVSLLPLNWGTMGGRGKTRGAGHFQLHRTRLLMICLPCCLSGF